MVARALVASLLVAILAREVRADDHELPGHSVSRPVDGGIQAFAFGAAFAAKLVPLRDQQPWQEELLSADHGVRDNFSRRASHVSDGLLALSVAVPAVYLTGTTIDDADGDRLLLYGQAMAINAAIASFAKEIVQRPRPYTYSNDPAVQAYAKSEGSDAYVSFYSGHAAISFCAATTGAYLLGASRASGVATGLAWGGGFAVAAATAGLRVRAGKHFYSDVVVGSLVGMTVGYLVPALHADDPQGPSGDHIALAGAGVLGGILISKLIPLEKKLGEAEPGSTGITFAPTPVEQGMGFAVAGGW